MDIANDKIESVALYKQDFFKDLSEINTINDRSSFKHLISIDTQDIFEKELLELMMPCVSSIKPLYKVFFATQIYPDTSEHQQCVVAKFVHVLNERHYVISKSHALEILHCEKDWLKCFNYLKKNAHAIISFSPINNRVLKTWWKRFSSFKLNDTGIFQRFNRILRLYNSNLKKNPNPLATVLSYYNSEGTDGYFFVPIYNALCNILKKRYSPDLIADRLEKLVVSHKQEDIKFLACGNFTSKTLIYCSLKMQMWESYTETCLIKQQMQTILSKFRNFLIYVTTVDEIEDFIIWIQEHFFPLIKRMDSENIYCWNPFKDKWQFISISEKKDVMHIILNHIVWYELICMMCQHSWFTLFSQVNLNKILDKVLNNFEDANPITLTEVSCINGANVPEFYILDKDESYNSFFKRKVSLTGSGHINFICQMSLNKSTRNCLDFRILWISGLCFVYIT